MAMTDSLISPSLLSKCCSTTNRRNRPNRSLREKPGLASTRSSCRRAAWTSDSPVGTMFGGYLLFSAPCKCMKPPSNTPGLVLTAWRAHRSCKPGQQDDIERSFEQLGRIDLKETIHDYTKHFRDRRLVER